MARLKSLLNKAKHIAGTPKRKIQESKARVQKRRDEMYQDDKQTVAEMRASGVEAGSPQDPDSLTRRQMRVDDYENPKPKRRLFRRNK